MPRRPPQRRDFGHIRKLPSGRYQASFTGPDLLRHNAPVTFEAKDLAIMWLLNEKRQIDDAAAAEARWVSPTERVEQVRKLNQAAETLGDYGRRWIVERRSSKGQPLRAMTKKDYEHTLAAYILPTLGKRPINQITRTDVRRWHSELAIPDRAKTKAYGLLRAIITQRSMTSWSPSRRCTSAARAPPSPSAGWSRRRRPTCG